MKRCILIVGILFIISFSSSAKIGFGAGADLSPDAARISVRNWFSKYAGAEIGFGPTANFEDFIFNDISIQAKFMKGIHYNRFARTYIGIIARYTMVKDPFFDKNLPSGGIFGGKEWYLGRFRNQGVAIEVGLVYGKKEGDTLVFDGNGEQRKQYYKDFPVLLSISYKYYF